MPDHYNFEKEEGQEYIYDFTTSKGIFYRVAFTEDQILNELANKEFTNIYTLTILRQECSKPGADPLIKITILEIIKTFFSFEDKCVMYICSEDDNKSLGRNTIFNKWYQECDSKDGLMKHDNTIYGNDRTVFTSLIYPVNCPNIDEILNVFVEIEKLYKNIEVSA